MPVETLDETAWLIENRNGLYLGEDAVDGEPVLSFVPIQGKPLRFSRKEDAASFLRMFSSHATALQDLGIQVCQHMWYTSDPKDQKNG